MIVIVSPHGEELLEIRSNVDRQQGRVDGVRSLEPFEPQLVSADDSQERKYDGQLNRYFDHIIESILHVQDVLIFGPGEAKGELKKRLEHAHFKGHIQSVETADKMTQPQIIAKVRSRFESPIEM